MANELEVKEITELNDVSFTDKSLVLAYSCRLTWKINQL